MKNFELEDRIKKLEKLGNDDRVSMLWQWAKQEIINLSEFRILLNEVISKMPTCTEDSVVDSHELGSKIVEYAKKYEGTTKYNDILLAIEFGYNLHNEEISVNGQ
jgi:hypothetical protein